MAKKKQPLADFIDTFPSPVTDSLFQITAKHPPAPPSEAPAPLNHGAETFEHPRPSIRKSQRFEDIYMRQTLFLRKDLIERLSNIAATQSKGFKTRLINEVLEKGLDDFEKSGVF
ncbi:hypothetical protein [Paenibacillus medicaginis]|uniref:CopG family transcriptional regulator n=1 Tax=Paenibacillus medicaginis TaxID=1470560 RepID=A0ABV5C4Q5_9BACL